MAAEANLSFLGTIGNLFGNTVEYLGTRAANALEKAKAKDNNLRETPRVSIVSNTEVAQQEARYLDRFSFLSDDTLQMMANRNVIVAAIIGRRCSQVSKFARPAHKKYSMGYRVELKEGLEPDELDAENIAFVEEFIARTGYIDESRPPEEWMNFEEWLRRQTASLMTFDRVAVEKTPCIDGSLHDFLPVDAATIRFARRTNNNMANLQETYVATLDREKEEERNEALKERLENVDQHDIRYVQIMGGRITTYYTRADMILRFFSPTNDIRLNGYSMSALEKLVAIVTSQMFAETHNRSYFCSSPDSLVRTKADGQLPIIEAFEKYGDNATDIWTGNSFHKGHFLKTRQLEECETHLKSGQILKTSDEHWFWVLREGRETPEYLNQRDLQIGDLLLVSPDGYESEDLCPRKIYSTNFPKTHARYREWDSTLVKEDLFEILGWMAGDGFIGGVDKVGREGPIQLFYHYQKELDIADAHLRTLRSYGINCELLHRKMSKSNIERCGHETSPRLFIHDVAFKRWLLDLGFGRSPNKGVPTKLFSMPKSYRRAFLKGLFSADGTIHKNKLGYVTPCLAAKNELTRSGAASLLNSLGVACALEKQTKCGERYLNGLRIQDIEGFKQIGFIQDYKNKYELRAGDHTGQYDLITKSLSKAIATDLLCLVPTKVGGERNLDRYYVNRYARGGSRLSRKNAISLCQKYNLEKYNDILSFKQIPVTNTIKTDDVIQMYDVEIFDSIHRYTIDGAVTHNTQGFSTRGILNIKGNIPQQQLDAFRREWYSQVSGAQNCLSGDSVIWTPQGAHSISNFLNGDDDKNTLVWTGTDWSPALVYKTDQLKKRCHTLLSNGNRITTSPDHKFRVMGDDGELCWKIQSELQTGDYVALNAQEVGSEDSVPSYNGKKLTPDMMEVLGWMTGDGSLTYNGKGRGKHNGIKLCYHHDKEVDIRDRHFNILKDFGLPAIIENRHLTQKQVDHCKEYYNFKSVANIRRSIGVSSVEFACWLVSQGFNPSRNGKVIPPFISSLPTEHKAAFLRGFFSADGNNTGLRSPKITIVNDRLRDQTKSLLLSMGIRTTLSEGKTRMADIKGNRKPGKSYLVVKDRDAFFNKVGFLQAHKQPRTLKNVTESNKQDSMNWLAIERFIRESRTALKGRRDVTHSYRNMLGSILCGKDGCSRPRLLRIMEHAGIAIPSHLKDYHYESVIGIERTDDLMQMYDLSVYDDNHQFVANGIILHNSFRTPIVGGEDVEVQWVPLQMNNRDMEWDVWMHYLVKVTCALYLIAPQEIGWDVSTTGTGMIAGDSGKRNMVFLTESKDVGLDPILRFFENLINEEIIPVINPELSQRYIFRFVGSGENDPTEDIERQVRELTNYKKLDEVRLEMGMSPIGPPLGEFILNPALLPMYEAMLFGNGEEGGEDKPKKATKDRKKDERETKSAKKRTRQSKGKKYK